MIIAILLIFFSRARRSECSQNLLTPISPNKNLFNLMLLTLNRALIEFLIQFKT